MNKVTYSRQVTPSYLCAQHLWLSKQKERQTGYTFPSSSTFISKQLQLSKQKETSYSHQSVNKVTYSRKVMPSHLCAQHLWLSNQKRRHRPQSSSSSSTFKLSQQTHKLLSDYQCSQELLNSWVHGLEQFYQKKSDYFFSVLSNKTTTQEKNNCPTSVKAMHQYFNPVKFKLGILTAKYSMPIFISS